MIISVQGLNCSRKSFKKNLNAYACGYGISYGKISRNLDFAINSASGDGASSLGFDVPFPYDYSELLQQAKDATELALKDSRQLMVCEQQVSATGN